MAGRTWKSIILGMVLALAVPLTGTAALFNVSTATELQTALTTAEANGEADIINIAVGTYNTDDNGAGATFVYTAAVTETFPLTLQGAGAWSTIIDGNNSRQVMRIDLTIFRGEGGVGAVDDANATVTVKDLTFRNAFETNFDTAGGLAIETYRADIVVHDCTFTDNTGGEAGGLLAFAFQGDVTLTHSTFKGNRGAAGHENGGGARLMSGRGDPDDQTESLVPGGDEGAKPGDVGNVIASHNIFIDNSNSEESDGGGLSALAAGGAVTVSWSKFERNRAGDEDPPGAGGVDTEGKGGGLHMHSFNGPVTLWTSTFIDNSAGQVGGGAEVWSKTNTATVQWNTFKKNLSGRTRENDCCSGDGGGLHLKSGDGSTVKHNTFVLNTSTGGDGAGAHVGTFGSTTPDDPSNNRTGAGATVSWNTFTWNRARASGSSSVRDADGGGLHARAGDASHLEVKANKFLRNVADCGGGGAYLVNANGTTDMTKNVLKFNRALGVDLSRCDDRVPGHGGGAHLDTQDGTIFVERNSVSYNAAEASSGGGLSINLQDGGEATLRKNVVRRNSAAVNGDDVFVDDLDDNTPSDTTGSSITLIRNRIGDFFSLCASTIGCTPDIGP